VRELSLPEARAGGPTLAVRGVDTLSVAKVRYVRPDSYAKRVNGDLPAKPDTL